MHKIPSIALSFCKGRISFEGLEIGSEDSAKNRIIVEFNNKINFSDCKIW